MIVSWKALLNGFVLEFSVVGGRGSNLLCICRIQSAGFHYPWKGYKRICNVLHFRQEENTI